MEPLRITIAIALLGAAGCSSSGPAGSADSGLSDQGHVRDAAPADLAPIYCPQVMPAGDAGCEEIDRIADEWLACASTCETSSDCIFVYQAGNCPACETVGSVHSQGAYYESLRKAGAARESAWHDCFGPCSCGWWPSMLPCIKGRCWPYP